MVLLFQDFWMNSNFWLYPTIPPISIQACEICLKLSNKISDDADIRKIAC